MKETPMNPAPSDDSAQALSPATLPLPTRSLNRGIQLVSDWLQWWHGLSLRRKTLPALGVIAYWGILRATGVFRPDHLHTGIILLALSYGGRLCGQALAFFLPLLLTGIVYDSQRYYGHLIRGRIHVSEPYLFDKNFFGIPTAQGVLTPNEWWQLHTHPFLDLTTGFFYLTFIAIFVSIAGYFHFIVRRKRRPELPTLQVMWGFFWLNVLGYSTYYWYAAAPPWYVTKYGLGPARMDALPDPAGCIRFDQLLGTSFFTGMYGKSANIFGAVPSLHISYPLLAVFFAFRYRSLRAFSVFFYAMMCFSAVYLNHHYVLDILWGSAYALLIGLMMVWIERKKSQAR